MAQPRRVALATYPQFPDLCPDDQLLIEPLRHAGIEPVPAIWSDERVDWSSFAAVVIRSTWDYYLHPERFLSWLDHLERSGARVFNPLPVLRWNLRKTYLRELEGRGIPIVPTEWIEPGRRAALKEILQRRGWREAVIKPIVSAGGHETRRVRIEEADSIPVEQGAMVQPYLSEITSQGEKSFLFFGGAFSHAIIKKAAPGEFRVQEKHGGTVHPFEPEPAELGLITRALGAVPFSSPLYARVDVIPSGQGLLLGEIELLEPSLYLAHHPEAPARFATALLSNAFGT